MRFVRGNVRDHIVTPKSTTVLRSGTTERFSDRCQRIDFREIFCAIRFSTFSTSGNGQQLFSGDR